MRDSLRSGYKLERGIHGTASGWLLACVAVAAGVVSWAISRALVSHLRSQHGAHLEAVALGRWEPGGHRPAPTALGERDISGTERHLYQIGLTAGDVLDAVVEQEGADVIVVLCDPAGRQLLEMDSPNGDLGPERLFAIAPVGGIFVLEVRLAPGASRGRYEARVEAVRAATDRDRARWRAALVYGRAEQMSRQRDFALLKPARELYLQARSISQQAGDRAAEALALTRLAQVEDRLGDPDAALASWALASDHYRELGRSHEQAVLLTNRGRLLARIGRQEDAIELLLEAVKLFASLGDQVREARVLHAMGQAHHAGGQPQAALRYLRQALSLWQQVGDPTQEATTLNSLAEVFISLGQLPLALDELQHVLQIRQRHGDQRGEAAVLTSLGTVYRRAGDLALARDCFQRALDISAQVGEEGRLVGIWIGLGLTELKLRHFESALASFRRALALAEPARDLRGQALALANIGWLEEERGDTDKALVSLERAWSILEPLRLPGDEASVLFAIALVKRRQGDLDAARVKVEGALARVESLRGQTLNSSLRLSYFSSKSNYYEFLVDVLMALHARVPAAGYDAMALGAAERGRAQSLLEMLSEARVDLGARVDPNLLSRERSLREEIAGLGSRAATAEETSRRFRRLSLELAEVEVSLREKHPQFSALTRPTLLTLDQLRQELLDNETQLLEYCLGEQRSFLWLVEREGLRVWSLPGRQSIEGLAREAHALLARSHLPGARLQTKVVLTALSTTILSPVIPHLNKRRLLIVADGALQYVPFGALPIPEPLAKGASLQPLLTEHEIVSLPSAAVAAVLRRQLRDRRPAPRTLAVLADPVLTRGDPRLPTVEASPPPVPIREDPWSALARLGRLSYSAAEADTILALVPPTERFSALGFAANLDVLQNGELAQYRILHFATHGWFHADYPELSGILLSQFDNRGQPRSGLLSAQEIYTLDLPADLVVLSACHTALGREVRGEGLLSLTRGFMYAGAPQVVVSLWGVDDQATAALMQRFYRGLLIERLAPATALRAAQMALKQEERWRAPYYWAGFILQGGG